VTQARVWGQMGNARRFSLDDIQAGVGGAG
jgi:hypothetical protein